MAKSERPAVTPPVSIEEVDTMLQELGRLDALEARNAADLEKAISQLKEKFGDRNFVDVDGETMPVADRRTALTTAIAAFAEPRKADLISAKRRFVKLNHGRFGWKKDRDTCEPVDGQTNKGRASLLEKLCAFVLEQLAKFEGTLLFAVAQMSPPS